MVNGTAYTFTIRAPNRAGWSPNSTPSAPVTPKTPSKPTMVITGSRESAGGGTSRVIVSGVTTELAGKVAQAHLRFAGQADYTEGATRRVSDNETFTRKHKTNRKLYVYFTTEDRTVRSNGLIIKP